MKLINQAMLKSAFTLAKNIRIQRIFLHLDCLDQTEQSFQERIPRGCELILVRQGQIEPVPTLLKRALKMISLPKINLGRIGLIKLSLAFALSNDLVSLKDSVLFLTGAHDQKEFDTILFTQIGQDNELITARNLEGIGEIVPSEVFERVLSIAVEFASKGREGKPIGTIFVVGDQERVMQLSKQMIINPFKGYEESERNILNPEMKETLREFSALDGAFVIGEDGAVLTAGRYLGAAYDEDDVPRGLGSRHIAAAGITSLTNAIAIVISESTGDVRIFKNGKILMEIEKP